MTTVYITIGYTGSGKSTWARQFVKDKPNTKIVSPDAFRTMLNGQYKYLPELDDVITESCFDTALNLISADYDVIIDCGNLTASTDRRDKWKFLPASRFIAVLMPMDKPVDWYVERRKKKPHWDKVNWAEIVENEMKAYEPPKDGEFDEIIIVEARDD